MNASERTEEKGSRAIEVRSPPDLPTTNVNERRGGETGNEKGEVKPSALTTRRKLGRERKGGRGRDAVRIGIILETTHRMACF